jgi:hypothetical protein
MEKLSKTLVIIGGILYLLFGLFHLTFFNFFNSGNPDFSKIVPFLSKIMVMLNVGVVIFFLSLGVIILRFRDEIINSKLGRSILLMSALFFTIRGLSEFAFSSYKLAFVLTMFLVAAVYIVPIFIRQK